MYVHIYMHTHETYLETYKLKVIPAVLFSCLYSVLSSTVVPISPAIKLCLTNLFNVKHKRQFLITPESDVFIS